MKTSRINSFIYKSLMTFILEDIYFFAAFRVFCTSKILAVNFTPALLVMLKTFRRSGSTGKTRGCSTNIVVIDLLIHLVSYGDMHCETIFRNTLNHKPFNIDTFFGHQGQGSQKKAFFFWTLSKSSLDPPPSFWTLVR